MTVTWCHFSAATGQLVITEVDHEIVIVTATAELSAAFTLTHTVAAVSLLSVKHSSSTSLQTGRATPKMNVKKKQNKNTGCRLLSTHSGIVNGFV